MLGLNTNHRPPRPGLLRVSQGVAHVQPGTGGRCSARVTRVLPRDRVSADLADAPLAGEDDTVSEAARTDTNVRVWLVAPLPKR